MSPAGFDKSPSAVDRRWPTLLLVCLLALGYVVTGQFQHTEPAAGVETDYRAPVANPVLEPDRPDLIGEPRIDEP